MKFWFRNARGSGYHKNAIVHRAMYRFGADARHIRALADGMFPQFLGQG
jgi:hypothetical protein